MPTHIALIGLTLIIVRSLIFAPVRKLWPGLLGCAQCTGMWVGMAAGAIGVVDLGHRIALNTLLVGASTSLLSLIVDAVLLRLLEDTSER